MSAVRAIETFADMLFRRVYRIEARGLENFTHAPSTLVVANHRRDADGPVICSVLLQRRGLKLRGVVPSFVAREDLFRRGFLADYLENWPATVRLLLARLDLSAFLRFMQAFPMRRVPERTLGEVLEAVLQQFGDLPLDEVLKPSWVEAFRGQAPAGDASVGIKEALARRYRPLLRTRRGLARLTLRRFQALKPSERAAIDSQLEFFVGLLERGGNVQLEPEGVVSVDGHFSRLRAALYQLINRSRVPVRVLPVGLTYDFMMPGRPKVFVNVGPEMTDLQGISRRETDSRVAAAIAAQWTVTASHLASRLLMTARDRGASVTSDELITYVGVEARRCAAAGVIVDPLLLDLRTCRKRIRGYLAYGLRSGVIETCGVGRYCAGQSLETPRPNWTERDGAIDYLNNELSSFMRLRPEVLGSPER